MVGRSKASHGGAQHSKSWWGAAWQVMVGRSKASHGGVNTCYNYILFNSIFDCISWCPQDLLTYWHFYMILSHYCNNFHPEYFFYRRFYEYCIFAEQMAFPDYATWLHVFNIRCVAVPAIITCIYMVKDVDPALGSDVSDFIWSKTCTQH